MMQSSKLRERLTEIVATVFGGNVNAAAEGGGVEQSTLHRIIEGKVTDPRLNTVRRLSDAFGVPFGWLLGEVSTEAAQAANRANADELVLPLPHAYWLIYSFHRAKQARLRQWLGNATGRSAEARKTLSDFAAFEFSPFDESFPILGIARLISDNETLSVSEIAVVRRCAELETAVIVLAVERAKKAGAESGRSK